MRQGDEELDSLGLERGDRILFVNGQPFRGGALDLSGTGDRVEIVVERGADHDKVELGAVVPPSRRAAVAGDIFLSADLEELYITPQEGAPAARAGVLAGDLIKAVDGEAVEDWDALVVAVGHAGADPLTLTVVRAEGMATIRIQPQRTPELGFLPHVPTLRESFKTELFGESLVAGWVASIDLVKQVYVTLMRLFTGEVSATNLGGPITIFRVPTIPFAQNGNHQ